MRSEKAQKLKFILVLELQKVRFLLTRSTQGVLASKFPISILRQIQGQDGNQILRKIV